MEGIDFNKAYIGAPPWDIGRAQRSVVELVERGEIQGPVLDLGCGTGENVLFLAGSGIEAWGIDLSSTAIERAREKAIGRELPATFMVFDALRMGSLSESFATVLDCGFFHGLPQKDFPKLLRGLKAVLPVGGRYMSLSFAVDVPPNIRAVKPEEFCRLFRNEWEVEEIRHAVFETSVTRDGRPAWLASIRRL